MRLGKFQFSLATLLLLSLLAGTIMMYASLYRNMKKEIAKKDERIAQIAEENEELKAKLGVLEIKDPTKIYVRMATVALLDGLHRWHIHLPQGHTYFV